MQGTIYGVTGAPSSASPGGKTTKKGITRFVRFLRGERQMLLEKHLFGDRVKHNFL